MLMHFTRPLPFRQSCGQLHHEMGVHKNKAYSILSRRGERGIGGKRRNKEQGNKREEKTGNKEGGERTG